MKEKLLLLTLLLPVLAFAEGQRKEAGEAFMEPLNKRDSILIADQFRYGVQLKNVAEGTPLALPVFKMEGESPLRLVKEWQADSVRVSARKEVPARYDIKASLVFTAFMGGTYELPDIPVLLDGDTLVFKAAAPVEITELPVDMETFEPHDIKPQVKFPYTLKELFPWIYGIGLGLMILAALVLWLIYRDKKAQETVNAEPAHIRALRKLDKYRGDKFWKPEQQKGFYSGVTDALREYIAARYGVGALEMTTAEIFEGLKGSEIPPDLFAEMKELFERADFVKFAKYTASDEDNAKVLPSAVRFVTETYQQEIDMGSTHPSGVRDDSKQPTEATREDNVIPTEASDKDNVIPSEASVSQKE